MTREQRAEYAEWLRQRANDLSMLQYIDFDNLKIEASTSGADFKTYVAGAIAAAQAQNAAMMASKDFDALAERIEANAD